MESLSPSHVTCLCSVVPLSLLCSKKEEGPATVPLPLLLSLSSPLTLFLGLIIECRLMTISPEPNLLKGPSFPCVIFGNKQEPMRTFFLFVLFYDHTNLCLLVSNQGLFKLQEPRIIKTVLTHK